MDPIVKQFHLLFSFSPAIHLLQLPETINSFLKLPYIFKSYQVIILIYIETLMHYLIIQKNKNRAYSGMKPLLSGFTGL